MPRIVLVAAVAMAVAVAVPSVAHGATPRQDGRTPDKQVLQLDDDCEHGHYQASGAHRRYVLVGGPGIRGRTSGETAAG